MLELGTELTVIEDVGSEIATWQQDIDLAQQHAANSDAASTRANYELAVRQFSEYVGRDVYDAFPASEGEVIGWISRLDAEGMKPGTIDVKVAGIAWGYRKTGYPFDRTMLKAVMSGIKRKRGTAPKQAPSISTREIKAIVNVLPDTPAGKRDRALILLGFATGMRRSELVGLDVGPDQGGKGFVEFVDEGVKVTLTQSKTDQEGEGNVKGVPYGWQSCPISALKDWIATAEISDGPIFRSVNRHGHVSKKRLTGTSVGAILRKRGQAAGIVNADKVTAHSLRASFVTNAHINGAALTDIMRMTGHVKVETTQRYIRDADLFSERNAARRLGL